MNKYVHAATVSALALTLSGGAFAATHAAPTDSTKTVAPAAKEPVPPAQADDVGSTKSTDTRPPQSNEAGTSKTSLSAEHAKIAEKLRNLVEKKLGNYVTREQDRAGVQAFYRQREFAPLWIGSHGPLPRAKEAIDFLHKVGADGLDPADYPTPNFADTGPDALAADELKLTNSVLTFARHASTGRTAFSRVSGAVYFDLKFPEPADILTKLASAKHVRDSLDSFNPQHPAYKALKTELAAQRGRAASHEKTIHIPDGPVLRIGMDDPRVPLLRKRLKLAAADGSRYDDALAAAVRNFQKKSGLGADGLVGPRTLAELNGESQISRVDTIIANMERWRWLPHHLGSAYVMVNVPEYRLKVVKNGETLWSTRIVVGKPGRYSTPLLTQTMKYITVNPTWNVPPSIIRNEYLPVLEQDPDALARVGLKIGRNADGSLRIYQPPGDGNALGRIRFNFPNRFLVYQHDTPDKYLFDKSTRAYSHGCMRVQNPAQYAEVLLSISQPKDGYTAARIRSLYGTGERTINFKNPIPVYVTYQTAFVDDAGHFRYRPDIYGIDKEITTLLHEDRRVADIPVARNYSSGSKPVMAEIPERRWDDPAARPYEWGPIGSQSYRRFDDRFRVW